MNAPVKTKPVHIQAALHKRLKAVANDRDSTLQAEVEQAIKKHLKAVEKRLAS